MPIRGGVRGAANLGSSTATLASIAGRCRTSCRLRASLRFVDVRGRGSFGFRRGNWCRRPDCAAQGGSGRGIDGERGCCRVDLLNSVPRSATRGEHARFAETLNELIRESRYEAAIDGWKLSRRREDPLRQNFQPLRLPRVRVAHPGQDDRDRARS